MTDNSGSKGPSAKPPRPEDPTGAPGPSGQAPPEPSAESELRQESEAAAQEELERIAEQLQQANERALRAQAELENYRKRIRREIEDERRYAALPLVRDLLPVLDNLRRAVEVTPANGEAESLLTGVRMVAAQMVSVLEQHHCQEIDGVGQPFDPHQHEALGQEPTEEFPAGTVTRVMRTGYRLHDRVVRPAQVFVATGPPQPEQPEPDA